MPDLKRYEHPVNFLYLFMLLFGKWDEIFWFVQLQIINNLELHNMEQIVEGSAEFPRAYQDMMASLFQKLSQLSSHNQQLREERQRDLVLLKNKELKIGELKTEIQRQNIVIFRMRKKQQLRSKLKNMEPSNFSQAKSRVTSTQPISQFRRKSESCQYDVTEQPRIRQSAKGLKFKFIGATELIR